MITGIMQPYFAPYLGYYSLMYHSDKWIFFDTGPILKKELDEQEQDFG